MQVTWLFTATVMLTASVASAAGPYGFPKGATETGEETAADGTRTIRYHDSNGNDVTVKIDPEGKATETVKTPAGKTSSREYEVEFDSDGTRTETSTEGSEKVERSFYPDGARKEITRTTEESVKGDSTTRRRHVRYKKYDSNGDLEEESEIDETIGLVEGWQDFVKKRRKQSTRYQNGKTVEESEERLRLERIEDGRPFMKGKRITKTYQDGKRVKHIDVWDNDTQQWRRDLTSGGGKAAATPYAYITPGLLHVPLDSQDGVGYQWGLGAGYRLWPFKGVSLGGVDLEDVALEVGGSIEHSPLNPSSMPSGVEISSHQIRVQAEARPGVMLLDERLFAYGAVGLGYVAWPNTVRLSSGPSTSTLIHGVGFSIGGGATYNVWSQLSVGAELGVDLQWFSQGSASYSAYNVDLEAVARWLF